MRDHDIGRAGALRRLLHARNGGISDIVDDDNANCPSGNRVRSLRVKLHETPVYQDNFAGDLRGVIEWATSIMRYRINHVCYIYEVAGASRGIDSAERLPTKVS